METKLWGCLRGGKIHGERGCQHPWTGFTLPREERRDWALALPALCFPPQTPATTPSPAWQAVPWTVSQNKLSFARHFVCHSNETRSDKHVHCVSMVTHGPIHHSATLGIFQYLSSSPPMVSSFFFFVPPPPTQWHCPGFCHYQLLNPWFITLVSGGLLWLRPCYHSSSPIWIFWHQCLLN